MEIVFKIMISRISGAGKIVKAELRDDRNGIDYFVEYNGLSPLTVDLKMSPKDPINEYGKDFSL